MEWMLLSLIIMLLVWVIFLTSEVHILKGFIEDIDTLYSSIAKKQNAWAELVDDETERMQKRLRELEQNQ